MTRTQNKEKAKKWLRLGLQLLAEREPEQTEQPSFKDLEPWPQVLQISKLRLTGTDRYCREGKHIHTHTDSTDRHKSLVAVTSTKYIFFFPFFFLKSWSLPVLIIINSSN